MMAKAGDWVLIHNIVLKPEERAPQVPDDTKKVPLECLVKGFLIKDGVVGDTVRVKTITGRIEQGTLREVNPTHTHDYGKFIPELLQIGITLRETLFGGEENE